jgi:hypothetical protein
MGKSYKELVEEYNIKKEEIYNKYPVNGLISDLVLWDKEILELEKEFSKTQSSLIKEIEEEYNIKKEKIYNKYVVRGVILDPVGWDKELTELETEFEKLRTAFIELKPKRKRRFPD